MTPDQQSEMKKFQEVVTVFLSHRTKILVFKRSREVSTYSGHWAGVSGYLERENPLDQAYTEMAEEVGLTSEDVTLLSVGEPLEIFDESQGLAWRVHPFLFAVHDPGRIRLDWENIEMRWIHPEELGELRTVPALRETLQRVI
jgi:ADP-ribose pyrophosphatase YjhB (NUDIX family)